MRAAGLAALALAALACNRPSPPTPSTSAAPPGASPPEPGPRRLPEDPVKAAQATLQWSEHLRKEEEERRLAYDHQHRQRHEVVLEALEKSLGRLDAAKTNAALTLATAAVQRSLPGLRQQVKAIDPNRQSSNLLADYDAILQALDGPYPAARVTALAGRARPDRELGAELARHLTHARACLAQAGEEE